MDALGHKVMVTINSHIYRSVCENYSHVKAPLLKSLKPIISKRYFNSVKLF
jgi:hypothetical protein